jgi:hypothetical protein
MTTEVITAGGEAIEEAMRVAGIPFSRCTEAGEGWGIYVKVLPAFFVIIKRDVAPYAAQTWIGISPYHANLVTSYFCCSHERRWSTVEDLMAHLNDWKKALELGMKKWAGDKLF